MPKDILQVGPLQGGRINAPARIFLHVPSWPGPFDVEIDCVAVI
jgi:enamine deaminase RidA (YjgF/YER057c/UK114 family)